MRLWFITMTKSTAPLTPTQQTTLLSLPGNSLCSECFATNPSWASLSHGTTLCLDCAGLHRGLGVHLSFVRSITMDDWSADQYHQMLRGGNDKWNFTWKEGNTAASLREREAWKAVHDGTKERREMREVVAAKYESDIAIRYRETIAILHGEETSIVSVAKKQAHQHVSLLEVEQPPTMEQCHAVTFPFTLQLLTSEPKNIMSLIMWTMCGFALSFWVNIHGPPSFVNMLVPTILSLTGFVPFYLVNATSRKFAVGWINHRQDAFNSARNLLVQLISVKKAQRLDTCDVYYPKTTIERKARVGLIFYPGALVDRTAYAPIAHKMAEEGIFVVIANLEPFRLVCSLKSYNIKENVMRMVSDSLLLGAQDGSGLWEVENWAIGGHSMGGSQALASCVNEMSSTMKKVVLWGVGTYPHPTMHACKPLREMTSDVDVLVLNGSNDRIISVFGGKDGGKVADEMEEKLPLRGDNESVSGQGRTFYVTIDGGNHSGCAHYGPQAYPALDGNRTITLEQQQDRMAKLTADFLLGNYAKLNSKD